MKSYLINIKKRVKESNLFKDSVYYTLLNVLEKAIPFIILPIVTRLFTKEEVGYYILYQAIIEILIPLMTLNIGAAVLLNYYKVDENNFKKYIFNSFILFFFFFIISFSFIYLLSDQISDLINFPAKWLIIVSFITLPRFITQLRQNLWRVKFKIKNYGYYTIGISLFKNGIGLILVFYFTLGWEGLILGHLIGYLIFALIGIYTFFKEKLISINIVPSFFKDAFFVGYPLALHQLGLWLGNAANRVIIAGILGTAATGSYGIGATFAMLITVVEDAFTKAFVPHLFEKLKKIQLHEKSEIVRLSVYVYIFLLVITAIFYIVGYFGVGFIFGHEYIATREFMLPLMLAALMKGLYKLHVNYIMFTKITMKVTQITLTTGLLNIFLAYILTLRYGIIGAAYSLLLVNGLQYLFSFYVANKLIPMPWLSTLKKMIN